MAYTPKQVEAIANHLQQRYEKGEIDKVSAVTAVIAMGASGRITETDVYQILLTMNKGSRMDLLASLIHARPYINKKLIDEIIDDVNSELGQSELKANPSPDNIENVLKRIRADEKG